jgi:hypothetical protein
MKFNKIIVSPFSTNVIDLIGLDYLFTPDGSTIKVEKPMLEFCIYLDGELSLKTSGNLEASAHLNKLECGRIEA